MMTGEIIHYNMSMVIVGSRFSAQYHMVGGILDQRALYNEFVKSGLKG